MNKFHAGALQQLTAKIASTGNSETVSTSDRELREYFATLYKNANKGIKGRSKDVRVVGSASTSHASAINMLGAGGSINAVGVLASDLTIGLDISGRMSVQHIKIEGREGSYGLVGYAVDNEDDVGRRGSCSSSSSSSSIYDIDASTDHYNTKGRELAFGDRIY
jgi:hypothetical protein